MIYNGEQFPFQQFICISNWFKNGVKVIAIPRLSVISLTKYFHLITSDLHTCLGRRSRRASLEINVDVRKRAVVKMFFLKKTG